MCSVQISQYNCLLYGKTALFILPTNGPGGGPKGVKVPSPKWATKGFYNLERTPLQGYDFNGYEYIQMFASMLPK